MYTQGFIRQLIHAVFTQDRNVIQGFADHQDPRIREASQAAADAVSMCGVCVDQVNTISPNTVPMESKCLSN